MREIEDLFSRTLHGTSGRSHSLLGISDWNPRVDISESDSDYVIKADIPGVAKDDLKVTVENGVLTVQGDRKQEKEEENKHFHRVERFYGSFTRSFSLPENADAPGLKAAAKDGQLTVTIPKKAASAAASDAVRVPVE